MGNLKWGFINVKGQYFIEPIFDSVKDFADGMAAVKIGEKWGYIDKDGYVVIEPKYDEVAWSFAEGLAWVRKGEKFYYIDRSGREVLGPVGTAEGSSFHEGYAIVGGMGIDGYIDRSGHLVIDAQYMRTNVFHNGVAIVRKSSNKEWGYVNTRGQFTPFYNIDDIEPFKENEGNYLRFTSQKKQGLMDRSGKIVINPEFDLLDFFHEGLARANRNGKRGFIDKNGDFAIEIKEEGMLLRGFGDFNEGLAPVKSGAKWGYIDKTGHFIIDPQFDSVGFFEGGYSYVKKDGKWYVINKNGQILFEPEFKKDDWHKFREGYAVIEADGKYGYIDTSRKVAIPPIYEEAYEFHEGFARVGVNKVVDTEFAFQKLPRRLGLMNSPSSSSKKSSYSTTKPTTKGNRQTASSDNGCYVATAVYGSYDCPEVWTLRRYRDYVLDRTWYGRLFIRTYYAISPTLVKWFGSTEWFRKLFYCPLTKWVKELNRRGFEDTPYKDKY